MERVLRRATRRSSSAFWPSHVFTGGAAEVDAALQEWQSPVGGPLPSSGPLVFDSWEKGVKMSFTRNDNYPGSVSPDITNTGVADVDGVEIRFVADTDAEIKRVRRPARRRSS